MNHETLPERYAGKDNYGRLKSDYLTKIAEMDDKAFYSECYSMIYQSTRCANKPRADWHWMVDACYDEAKRRDDGCSIYVKAYDCCYADHWANDRGKRTMDLKLWR